jgi:hypothetical protein
VYVAANGDELYLDTFVQGCGNGVDRAETIGTYTITGGTGRFAGATGVGTSSSTVVQGSLAGSLMGSLRGTITY